MKPYLKYIFEVLAIVVGITLSFMVDEWREDNEKNKKFVIVLNEMKTGLDSDLIDLEYNLETQKTIYNSQGIILNWLLSEEPYVDSIGIHLNNLSWGSIFVSTEGIYDVFKEISATVKVSTDLRKNILETYDKSYDSYVSHNERYLDMIISLWENVQIKYFLGVPENGKPLKPKNIESLKLSDEFYHSVLTMRSFNKVLIGNIQTAMESAKVTLDRIEITLNK